MTGLAASSGPTRPGDYLFPRVPAVAPTASSERTETIAASTRSTRNTFYYEPAGPRWASRSSARASRPRRLEWQRSSRDRSVRCDEWPMAAHGWVARRPRLRRPRRPSRPQSLDPKRRGSGWVEPWWSGARAELSLPLTVAATRRPAATARGHRVRAPGATPGSRGPGWQQVRPGRVPEARESACSTLLANYSTTTRLAIKIFRKNTFWKNFRQIFLFF